MAPTRRQIYRRRRIVVFGGLGLALALLVYLPLTLLAPLRAASMTLAPPVETPPEVPALALPGYGAAAVGAVGFPGALGQSGTTDPVPMASITKVVTALVVLDAYPLAPGEQGPSVTMTSDDVGFYRTQLARNGGVAPVSAGLVFTQRELLELTLIKSANNYADSLAAWAFGSADGYLAAAAAWLAAHDLADITVVDASGIDPANRAPSAALIELGKIALEDPVVAQIVATPSGSVPNVGAIPNTNKLLGIDGVDGIKTGTLDGFGANLLFSADYLVGDTTVTVVGVVLGGSDHDVIDRDILTLLGTVVDNFTEVEVAADGERFGTLETLWGLTVPLVASDRATLLTWGDEEVATEITTTDVVTGEAGDDVGDVDFRVGDRSTRVDLELASDVTDPGPWWRLTNPALLF